MKVETVSINVVKPYWRNPRKSDRAVEAVKSSIERYGFNQPIIVDDENVIIAGHTRYKALRELGWEEIPIVKVDLPPEKVKEYRIADNKTSELAEWDTSLLIPELREIVDIGDMSVFFPDEDLSRLIDPAGSIKVDNGPSQEEVEEKSQAQVTNFADSVFERKSSLVDVICPKCGHEFQIPAQG